MSKHGVVRPGKSRLTDLPCCYAVVRTSRNDDDASSRQKNRNCTFCRWYHLPTVSGGRTGVFLLLWPARFRAARHRRSSCQTSSSRPRPASSTPRESFLRPMDGFGAARASSPGAASTEARVSCSRQISLLLTNPLCENRSWGSAAVDSRILSSSVRAVTRTRRQQEISAGRGGWWWTRQICS